MSDPREWMTLGDLWRTTDPAVCRGFGGGAGAWVTSDLPPLPEPPRTRRERKPERRRAVVEARRARRRA